MAASSSGSCKSLTSKAGEVASADPRLRSSDAELCACDTFCHALQEGIAHERSQLPNHDQGDTVASSTPTRKAEREKLRRDRLNKQLLELAGALGEPDRPKNDKSTILSDAIQTLKELMTDVECLRAEHAVLVDEAQDLSQEKKELHEERLHLTSRVQHLQTQVWQQMHSMLLWMASNPASMMGAYTTSSSSHGASEGDTRTRSLLGPSQTQSPLLRPQSMPLVPHPMAVHPALQAHYGYSGGGTYFPYPFNYVGGAPSQAELPCAQVSQGYPLQVHCSPLMHPMAVAQAASYSQAYGPQFPFTMPSVIENQNQIDAGKPRGGSSGSNEQHPGSNSVKPCINEHLANTERHVRPTMQLQSAASLSGPRLQQSTLAFDNQNQNSSPQY